MKSTNKPDAAGAFAARLRDAMLRRGYASPGSRSGVDVAKLAEAASTTYEMARRYAEGAAMPRPDKLAAIAAWLGVTPAALAWGEERSSIDLGLLERCLQAVREAQDRAGRRIPAEKAAHLVALLYQEALDGRFPTVESMDLLIKSQ